MNRLDHNAWYALGVPVYLLLCLLEGWLARRRGIQAYGFSVTAGSFTAGLGEVILGLFLGPYLLALYDYGYETIALVRWPEGSLAPWVLAFVAGDFCYYWYHRAGHRIGLFWAIHGVHHQSEEFNLSLAIRHPWFSDFYSAPFYALLPILGVPAFHFFVAISIISFYALTVHTDVFHRGGLGVLVTPRTHVVHHSVNPRYLNRNFGASLVVWDRLFGTHAEVDPADPPRLGMTTGYETHDGARAQWVILGRLLAVARQASTWRERLLTFAKPPGWRPAGAVAPPLVRARPDAEVPGETKAYVAVQLSLVVVFAMWLLWLRDGHSFAVMVASSAVILWSVGTIGALLDGRPGAGRRELLRLGGVVLLGAWLVVAGRTIGGGVVLAGLGSAVGLVAFRGRVAPSRA